MAPIRNISSERLTSGWGVACALSILLLGLSYLRIWGDSASAAFGGKIIDVALAQPIWTTALGSNLLLFALAQIAIHLSLGLVCIFLGVLSNFAWRVPTCKQRDWILLWCIFITAWVLIANAAWFPTSSLGSPYANIVALSWHGVDFVGVASGLLLAAISATMVRALSRIRIGSFGKILRAAVPIASVLMVVAIITSINPVAATSSPNQPNVIFIGLDSLRFDAIGRGNTPAIDRFLSESATFVDASTPLARTFPAWVSLLSGRHPHTTGATMNLLPRDSINTGQTLPQLLRQSGYKAIYAIDEVRFSNLDTTYGFDQMIAPPIGATDFVLGFFADTPLSNVLINTPIGRLLFPYSYANRAAAITYDPDTFIDRIDNELREEGPIFLAAHFTLGHWPYAWAGVKAPPRADTFSQALEQLYRPAIARLDQQFADLMHMLNERGLLANAIVVVLSDHGESLGGSCGEDHSDSKVIEAVFDKSKIFGHGTSVFSEDQYHVILGFRSFGQTPLSRSMQGLTISAPVSLEDVTPTIVELLSLSPEGSFDGVSLVPLLQESLDPSARFAGRIRFTETEFNPPGIALGGNMTTSALRSAAGYYRVDPATDRVTMRVDDVDAAMAKRQYAAFRDGKLLAAFPSQDRNAPGLQLAYITQRGSLPETLTSEAALQAHPDAARLWSALRDRFPDLQSKIRFPTDDPGMTDNN